MKTIRNILLFTVIMALVFVIAACNSDGGKDKATTTAATTTEPIIAITTTAPTTTEGGETPATTTEPAVTTTLAPITSRTITPPTDIELITPTTTYFTLTIQVPVAISEDKVEILEFEESQLGVGDLVLVNSNHAIIDEELLLDNMDLFYGNRAQLNGSGAYGLRNDQVKGAKTAIAAINEMILAYKEQGGTLYPIIYGAYRSVADQEATYREYEKTYGDDTPLYVSVPGCSDYHTGLGFTFKIKLDSSQEGIYELNSAQAAPFYNWLKENAHKYGFIFRYPENKEEYTGISASADPYHIRYVGKAHALFMEQYDLCLEEYIDYLRSYEHGKYHLIMYFIGTQYEIFFVKNEAELDTARITWDATYEISGNNVDGYIVTLYRDLTLDEAE